MQKKRRLQSLSENNQQKFGKFLENKCTKSCFSIAEDTKRESTSDCNYTRVVFEFIEDVSNWIITFVYTKTNVNTAMTKYFSQQQQNLVHPEPFYLSINVILL